MQPNGQTELTPAQQKLMAQFANANDILFERTSNGVRLVVYFDGRHTQGMRISVPDFGEAITGLIAPGIDPSSVSRVLIKRVSPQSDFSSPDAMSIQFFNVQAYDANRNKLGGDGLRECPAAATKLAARLQVA